MSIASSKINQPTHRRITMSRNFNWNYNTAHRMGHSRVRDQRDEAFASFTDKPNPLEEPLPRTKRSHELTNAEWEADHA